MCNCGGDNCRARSRRYWWLGDRMYDDDARDVVPLTSCSSKGDDAVEAAPGRAVLGMYRHSAGISVRKLFLQRDSPLNRELLASSCTRTPNRLDKIRLYISGHN